MFIADYDNLRFDFIIFIFFGMVWERFGNGLGKTIMFWRNFSCQVYVGCKNFWSERFLSGGWGD